MYIPFSGYVFWKQSFPNKSQDSFSCFIGIICVLFFCENNKCLSKWKRICLWKIYSIWAIPPFVWADIKYCTCSRTQWWQKCLPLPIIFIWLPSSYEASYMCDARFFEADEPWLSDIVICILSSKTRDVLFYKTEACVDF